MRPFDRRQSESFIKPNISSTEATAVHITSSQENTNAIKPNRLSTLDSKRYRCDQVIETNKFKKEYIPEGKKINQYLIIKEIGRGEYGKVKQALNLDTREDVAIKVIDLQKLRRKLATTLLRHNNQHSNSNNKDVAEQEIRREINILKKCRHPNVVRLLEVIRNPATEKIYLVLEYMEGGELQWKDDDNEPILNTPEIRPMFRDIVCGLDYLHFQGVIHRDIKPANLLKTKCGVVKISDFGVSYYNECLAGDGLALEQVPDSIRRELAKTAGTLPFFAPELCYSGDADDDDEEDNVDNNDNDDVGDRDSDHGNDVTDNENSPHHIKEAGKCGDSIGDAAPSSNSTEKSTETTAPPITKAIDVWALGVTLYCFVFGKCPFYALTRFELFNIIPKEPLSFPESHPIPESLKDLLQKLLTKNPERRITLDQVKDHPWVTEDLDEQSKLMWLEQADPRRYQAIQVAQKEVTEATATRLSRFVRSIGRSVRSILVPSSRRRSSQQSAPNTRPLTTHITSMFDILPDHASPIHETMMHGAATSTLEVEPGWSPTAGSAGSSLDMYGARRPTMDRSTSSASSLSGLHLTSRANRLSLSPCS